MIRDLEDESGRSWEVVLGRSSWGGWQALFIPRDGGESRETVLDVRSAEAATVFMNEAGHEELAGLFERSAPRRDF